MFYLNMLARIYWRTKDLVINYLMKATATLKQKTISLKLIKYCEYKNREFFFNLIKFKTSYKTL